MGLAIWGKLPLGWLSRDRSYRRLSLGLASDVHRAYTHTRVHVYTHTHLPTVQTCNVDRMQDGAPTSAILPSGIDFLHSLFPWDSDQLGMCYFFFFTPPTNRDD